mmetsp:Transcript_13738/g.31714  ORF Transcript_13738/g.31714 Transcript_13738/m.31714 type:complete len:323 (-) Transcript_13738:606-1574(-)
MVPADVGAGREVVQEDPRAERADREGAAVRRDRRALGHLPDVADRVEVRAGARVVHVHAPVRVPRADHRPVRYHRVIGDGGHAQRAIDPALRPQPPHHARPVRASAHETFPRRTHCQRVRRGCVPHETPNHLSARHVPDLDEVAPGAPSHDLLARGREEEPPRGPRVRAHLVPKRASRGVPDHQRPPREAGDGPPVRRPRYGVDEDHVAAQRQRLLEPRGGDVPDQDALVVGAAGDVRPVRRERDARDHVLVVLLISHECPHLLVGAQIPHPQHLVVPATHQRRAFHAANRQRPHLVRVSSEHVQVRARGGIPDPDGVVRRP